MKKRSWIFALVLVLSLSALMLSACSSGNGTDNTPTGGNENTEPTSSPDVNLGDEEPTSSPAVETEEPNTDTEGDETPMELQEIRDIPSVELVKEIKIGWNLGNTMDATGGTGRMSEMSWGNPKTTKEMIDAVKAGGFNTLRIPTTWEKHLGPAPDYKIDKLWLDRVQEIVDYGIENDMFVIINMHHEEWHFPSYENAEKAKDILTKVWKQIADRFQAYDEHLIFEGMNEPRQKGTKDEWNGGNAEGWDVVNQLNAAFIETIRNSGGNNPLRHLMIPPYAAAGSTRAWAKFEVPDDDKIIVSIHAYTPYNFTLNKTGTNKWSVDNFSDTREIDDLMKNIEKNFTSKGIPVIIGEFGAMNKDNVENRAAWAEYYIRIAKEKGIPCIWWDNGAFEGSGELFGLIDRRALTWKYPEVLEGLMKGLE